MTEYLNSQPQAREKAEKEGFEVSVAKTSFKANTKALAENEGEGLAKVRFPNSSSSIFLCKHNLNDKKDSLPDVILSCWIAMHSFQNYAYDT